MNVFDRLSRIALFWLLLPLTASGQDAEPEPLKMLFIGNSYTAANNLPAMVEGLAEAAGGRKIHADRHLVGGCTLERHVHDKKAIDKIHSDNWDVVVLQEQSLRPVIDRQAMHTFARRLDAEIKGQGAKTVFYLTWARQHIPEMQEGVDPATSPDFARAMMGISQSADSIEFDAWSEQHKAGLQGGLNGAYGDIARELGADVAPVGIAWKVALAADSELVLHRSDKSHPNPAGTYLAACVFYATLLGESPVGLPGQLQQNDASLPSIPDDQARQLQEVAWATVRNDQSRDYSLNGPISRLVLDSYLARSMTMLDLLTGRGDVDDNIRMLKTTGVKFAGRTIYLWGHESGLPGRLAAAREIAPKVHAADAEIILQACAFEIVSKDVEKLPVPTWAFEAFGISPEERNFRYEEMLYPSGRGRDHWQPGASIPDISRTETKLWFYFLAVSYMDVGCEAIHFGQAEIMDGNDPDRRHWWELLQQVRQYAASHARRRGVVCDAHVPGGGMRHGENLLFDFHSFPLRIVEVPERPQEGILGMGAFDAIYGRSMGGVAPGGWRCDHLPYLVELDNWGVSGQPGQAHAGSCWVWGYDEISWFAHQDEAYRNQWLRYAWDWVREHDPNGFFQMPGSRVLHASVNGHGWYYANTPSDATPRGFGQEETIKAIWSQD